MFCLFVYWTFFSLQSVNNSLTFLCNINVLSNFHMVDFLDFTASGSIENSHLLGYEWKIQVNNK